MNVNEILKAASESGAKTAEERFAAIAEAATSAGFDDAIAEAAVKAGYGAEKTASSVKEVDGRKVLFSKLSVEDLINHLASEYGRPEQIEKAAAEKPATAKFASLLSEALARPE